MSIWDDPDMKVNDNFVKFDNVGDTISGEIITVRAHRFDDNTVAPQILLKDGDGEERTVTCGQVRLKAALAQERPEAGDRITITLSDVEKRSGGKTLKHFDVNVQRGGTARLAEAKRISESLPDLPPAPQESAPPAPVADAQAAAAALAALTDDQKKALGLA